MSVAQPGEAARDAWMLSVAPRLLSLLPVQHIYAGCRAFAQWGNLFAEPTDAAARAAPACLPIADVARFRRDVRTLWLLDVTDLYVSRRKPVDWLPPDLAIRGEWPRGSGFVAVTFHYGTGLWLCRSLRRHARGSVFVSGRFERDEFAQRTIRHRYGMRRLAEVERIGGEAIAYRPGVRETLLGALRRRVPVLGLIDVPPRLAPNGQHPVRLLDRPASLPEGLLVLASEAGVPIVPCWVEIDFASGRRTLVIGEACAPEPVGTVLADRVDVLA